VIDCAIATKVTTQNIEKARSHLLGDMRRYICLLVSSRILCCSVFFSSTNDPFTAMAGKELLRFVKPVSNSAILYDTFWFEHPSFSS
jgi:hypothetical protein